MSSLLIYGSPQSGRLLKVQIAAQYTGTELKYSPGFEFKVTNKTPEFLAKFPVGKIPAADTPYGTLTESNAIARYVARLRPDAGLLGSGFYQQSLVDQWIDFASFELDSLAPMWLYPALGYGTFEQKKYETGKEETLKVLTILDKHLISNTFVTGDTITLADIILFTSVRSLFTNVITEATAGAWPSIVRWFNTLLVQKQFSAATTFEWAKTEKYAVGNPLAGAAGAAPAAEVKEVKAAAPAPTPAPAVAEAAKPVEDAKPEPAAAAAAEPAAKEDPKAGKGKGKKEPKKAEAAPAEKAAEPAPAEVKAEPAAAPKEDAKAEKPKGKGKGKQEAKKEEAKAEPAPAAVEVKAAEPAPAPAAAAPAAAASPEPKKGKKGGPKAEATPPKIDTKEAPKAAAAPGSPEPKKPETPKSGKKEAAKAAPPASPKGAAKQAAPKGKGKK